MKRILTSILFFALSGTAFAQDAVDVGVIKNADVKIVQQLLYPKTGRSEIGFHTAVMPFDAYTFTPAAAFTYASHFAEDKGIEVVLMGGYGMKNATYKELEGPAYGVAPDAYRFLGSAMVDFQYSRYPADCHPLARRIPSFLRDHAWHRCSPCLLPCQARSSSGRS